ncbi:hypothetical protein DIE18_04170 [Burkholderia sp. Bp9125]|nr:hypothetical protein DIE18_04170 [Burkholderia sp. Bp9125]
MRRLLNMNELSSVRRTHLANHACIGKGSFASVYASCNDSASVVKITTDQYGYSLLADYVWHEIRSHVDGFFPRLIENHGDVGECNGLTAYLVEVERLYPVASTEHRRRIARWCKELSRVTSESYISQPDRRMRQVSLEFCERKANQDDEPYAEVFGALYDFLRNYGGALDMKRSNFMQRADGTLVWNDIVFDIELFCRHNRVRH